MKLQVIIIKKIKSIINSWLLLPQTCHAHGEANFTSFAPKNDPYMLISITYKQCSKAVSLFTNNLVTKNKS